jgi:glycosyltransferase involved in cell wall biosynthesis
VPQRILYCTDSLMAGGTEHQLVTLISHLDRKRFAPYVVCLYGEWAGRSLHFLDDLRKLHVPVLLLNLTWSSRDKLCAVGILTRIVWRIRPQIVQAVNYHSNLLLRFARPFLPPSTRLIGCIYVEYTPKQLVYEYVMDWLCNAIVCNSLSIQQQLPKYLSPQLIFNGVDFERFTCNPDPTLRSRVSPQAKYVFLVIGRVTRQKSPHLFIEALGLLKERDQLTSDIAVWIVGESQDKDVQQQIDVGIHRHSLENVVVQFPATNLPESYYHAADVVVLPSLWEGLPNVILEALAAGKPLIISEAGNTAEVVVHGANGWIVKTGDVEDLASALREILPLDLSAMRLDCQASVLPFSVMKMVRDYELLYERLSARS